MRKIAFIIFALFTQWVKAFDPIPPYASDSIETTIELVNRIIPAIDYPKESVEEVVEFLELTGDIPERFRVHFSFEGFADLSKIEVKLVEKNITKLGALAKLAAQIDADIIIRPAKVILRRRTTEDE